MKNSVKGAIAAGAAGVLLLGGIGTLAYWSDSETIDGGSVTAGTLSLGEPVCTPTDNAWVYAVGNAGEGEPVTRIVPGDTISKSCAFPIVATGDNLTATLEIPDTTTVTGTPTGTTLNANVSAVYASSGTEPITGVITDANNGDIVTATIQVEFPFGNDTTINADDMQSVLASLANITVTLTQTES